MTGERFVPEVAVGLLASDPSGMSREELHRFLQTSAQLDSWREGRDLLAIQALDKLTPDVSSPAKDTAGEVGRDQNLGRGESKRKTRTAQQMPGLPHTQAALAAGRISGRHAEAMAAARSRADGRARGALREHEASLVDAAATETAWEFTKRLERFVKRHSEEDGRSNWDRMKDREELSLVPSGDGMYRLSGLLHPEPTTTSGRVLRAIAEELYRRDHRDHPADQPVPPAELANKKRLAEAFHEMARRAEGKPHPTTSHERVITILQYDQLLDLLGPDATLPDGTPIPADVARRMCCTAGHVPMVLNGKGVPLDLGREKRLAQPGQRVALGVQWATCSIADCTIPFEWSEIHHLDPFETGGPTDLANLTPACRHCHDLAHTPGWTVTKHADGTVTTVAPDGTTWHRRPDRRRTGPPLAAAPHDHEPAATLFTTVA